MAAIIGALAGAIAGLVTARYELRQKDDELFLKSMEFLGGGSQKRNLGIAAIELYWSKYEKHRALCIALLIGSAIYLLLESEQDDAAHETYNLKRIMDLLLNRLPFDTTQRDRYLSLEGALETKCDRLLRKENEKSSGGLRLPRDLVEGWREQLKAKTGAQPSSHVAG